MPQLRGVRAIMQIAADSTDGVPHPLLQNCLSPLPRPSAPDSHFAVKHPPSDDPRPSLYPLRRTPLMLRMCALYIGDSATHSKITKLAGCPPGVAHGCPNTRHTVGGRTAKGVRCRVSLQTRSHTARWKT